MGLPNERPKSRYRRDGKVAGSRSMESSYGENAEAISVRAIMNPGCAGECKQVELNVIPSIEG